MGEQKQDPTVSPDGEQPDEEVGPDECEGGAKRCEFRAGDLSGGVEQSEFEMADEVHDQFPVEEIPIGTDALDGMPVPMTGDPQAAQAPAFTYETVVCVEDDRQYVELFRRDIIERGWRPHPNPNEPGSWAPPKVKLADLEAFAVAVRSRFGDDGSELKRRFFEPSSVEHIWGVDVVLNDDGNSFIPVRPIRERCEHYRRQVFSNDDQPDPNQPGHQIVFRNCTARRSNGGAFMSLRDEAVYVCDYRSPPDRRTEEEQDRKDRDKLVNRPDLLRVPLFGTEGDDVQVEESSDE